MKIRYVITRFATGGAELHTRELALRILKKHDVMLICQRDDNITDWLLDITLRAPQQGRFLQDGSLPVFRTGLAAWEKIWLWLPVRMMFTLRGLPMAQWVNESTGSLTHELIDPLTKLLVQFFKSKLRPLLKDADIIHCVHVGACFLDTAALELARERKIPFVFTPYAHVGHGWDEAPLRRIYRQADAVIAMTDFEKNWLVKMGACEERVFVTGAGPVLKDGASSPGHFRRQYGIKGQMVLFVGQKFPWKGYRQILEAAKFVWEKFPETFFVFIGPEYADSAQVFLKHQDRRILNVGIVEAYSQTKTDAFAACDIFCLPSTGESFGGVFTEAWSFSKPVIAGDIPAVREVVSDGVDGFLVPQEPEAIAEKILLLLSDDGLRRRMGEGGRKKVLERFNWDRIAAKTEEIYQTVCHRHQPSAISHQP